MLNVNLKILLFHNQIYGLTKGQYSPTSEEGNVTKSTPFGSVDHPFNPISLALGAEATFVARTLDTDRAHLTRVLEAAYRHRGAAFVEIYQNCVVFNDDAFVAVTDKQKGVENRIELEHGEPIVFANGQKAVIATGAGGVEIVDAAEAGDRVLVHDAHADDPSLAFAISRLSHNPTGPTPLGIFRQVDRPLYEDVLTTQIEQARERQGPGGLRTLLEGGNVWEVTPN